MFVRLHFYTIPKQLKLCQYFVTAKWKHLFSHSNTLFPSLVLCQFPQKTICHFHDTDTFIGFFRHDLCDKNINFIPSNIERTQKSPPHKKCVVNNEDRQKILIAIMHSTERKKHEMAMAIKHSLHN